MPPLIVPSLRLNASIPWPNMVSYVPKQARMHFASQNRAYTVQFLFLWPKPALPHTSPYHAFPAPQFGIPHPNTVSLPQNEPTHTLLAKRQPPQFGF